MLCLSIKSSTTSKHSKTNRDSLHRASLFAKAPLLPVLSVSLNLRV